MLVRVLAMELRRDNTTVNEPIPGPIHTACVAQYAQDTGPSSRTIAGG